MKTKTIKSKHGGSIKRRKSREPLLKEGTHPDCLVCIECVIEIMEYAYQEERERIFKLIDDLLIQETSREKGTYFQGYIDGIEDVKDSLNDTCAKEKQVK